MAQHYMADRKDATGRTEILGRHIAGKGIGIPNPTPNDLTREFVIGVIDENRVDEFKKHGNITPSVFVQDFMSDRGVDYRNGLIGGRPYHFEIPRGKALVVYERDDFELVQGNDIFMYQTWNNQPADVVFIFSAKPEEAKSGR